MGVLRVHLGPTHRLYHDVRRVRGPVASPGSGYEPVVMIGRHQHELPATMPCNFNWLTPGRMLVLAEIALEFHG